MGLFQRLFRFGSTANQDPVCVNLSSYLFLIDVEVE